MVCVSSRASPGGTPPLGPRDPSGSVKSTVIDNRNVDRGPPLVTLRPAKWCCFDLAQIPAEIAALLCTTKAQPDSGTFHLVQGYPIRANVPATRPKRRTRC